MNLQLEKRILTRGIPPVSEYFPQSNGGGGDDTLGVLSNLELGLGIGLGICSGLSQVVYEFTPYTLRNASLLGGYHLSVNVLSRKSNEGEIRIDTADQGLEIEALSNLGLRIVGLGLSQGVFEFTP